MKKKLNKKHITELIERHTWIVLVVFSLLIFFTFRDLFGSYFEADEWFHFTYYLPLTNQPGGFLTALASTFTNTGPLSGGQHIIPIASSIYFLNTKFFGLNYAPYALMSLTLHSINSFLIFLLLRVFLHKRKATNKNIFALFGGVFFAFSPVHTHAIAGAAPFYGQNVLSVTFFILSILIFKLAFIRKQKRLIYLSILFLFLALFFKGNCSISFSSPTTCCSN